MGVICFKLGSPQQFADLHGCKTASYNEGQTVLLNIYKETNINGTINFHRISNTDPSSRRKYNLLCSYF